VTRFSFLTRFKSVLIIPVFALGLAACEVADPAKPLPQLSYDHLAPINLGVSDLEVVTKFQSPLKRPNVEHRFDTRPADALASWARSRINPVGGPLRARLVIDNAAAIEEQLKLDKSFTGTFKKEQSARYTLTLAATLEILDPAGQRVGHASTQVSRGHTTREDASFNDLREEWFELTEKSIAAFNVEMEKTTRQYLSRWVR